MTFNQSIDLYMLFNYMALNKIERIPITESRPFDEDLFSVSLVFLRETLFHFILVIKFNINSYPKAIIKPVQKIKPEVKGSLSDIKK